METDIPKHRIDGNGWYIEKSNPLQCIFCPCFEWVSKKSASGAVIFALKCENTSHSTSKYVENLSLHEISCFYFISEQ